MKTKVSSVLGLFFVGLILGCGSDFTVVPVSGTVSMDGEPEQGIKVIFMPLPLEENPSPGPFSTAITDENGAFVLKTRRGKTGAIVGHHLVSFVYLEFGPGYEAASSDREMPARYKGDVGINFEVPRGGNDAVKFELTSDDDDEE